MSPQNESWWIYLNSIPFIVNLIIITLYYYYCIYSYKDPPNLQKGPTTKFNGNLLANKKYEQVKKRILDIKFQQINHVATTAAMIPRKSSKKQINTNVPNKI